MVDHHRFFRINRPSQTRPPFLPMSFFIQFLTTITICLAQDQITLLDILNPADNQRLFDTLSESVKNEYSRQTTSFDSGLVFKYERAPVSIGKLNAKYRHVLYQGDMVMLPERLERIVNSNINNKKKRQAFVDYTYPASIWSAGVPYNLHWSLTPAARASIQRAINFWQSETCINFRPRTTESQFLDFIGNDDGCWSTVGKDDTLKRQVVSIGRGCEHFGVTSHELAHALGLFHEQSRYDRDQTVRLNPNVVSGALLYNFAKVSPRELSTYNLPYDVGSVMHYTPTEFSTSKLIPALTAVDPNLQQTMGQLEEPSFLDIQILNLHYNCASRCTRQLNCQNGGFTNPRNCAECKCPSGYSGPLCQTPSASFSRGCGGELLAEEVVRRFDITIRQIGQIREKECAYHIKAPPGKKVLVNMQRLGGRCIEGCWVDRVEFKMSTDPRATGYRFCCREAGQRRIISQSNIVPFMVTSKNDEMSVTFEYTYVDANSRFDGSQESVEKESEPVVKKRSDQFSKVLVDTQIDEDGLQVHISEAV